MALALVARAAPARRLELWLGVADAAAPPALAWQVDGTAAAPRVVRALEPARRGALAGPGGRGVYTGCFELAPVVPGAELRIEVSAGAERIARRVRPLPERVPDAGAGRFQVLLLSCFHRLEDRTGVAGAVLSRVRPRPDLALFAGDQVYLDLPSLSNFESDPAALAARFERDYAANWFGAPGAGADPAQPPPGFPQLLALAPAAFLPDDHEYWNNYPFASPVVQNSWGAAGREHWRGAAAALYAAFQQRGEAARGDAWQLDVEPLSILGLDTRSLRRAEERGEPGALLGGEGRKRLDAWASELVARAAGPEPRFGLLLLGQSLFRAPSGALRGAVGDRELADYPDDYAFIVGQLERVSRAGAPLVTATGDVHWSRVLRAEPPLGGAPIYEVISSPTSLVTSAGIDTAKRVGNALAGLFGAGQRWPRHGDPQRPPERFGSRGQYRVALLQRSGGGAAAMRGNQALALGFARAGGGLDAALTAYPLSGDPRADAAEQWSLEFKLRPGGTPP